MMASRLDITQIFWDVDDFCLQWSRIWRTQKQLPSMPNEKRCRSRMTLSEVMTIVIAFHGSGFRTFKEFYALQVLPHWKRAFPNLVSYNRFVELMPWCLMLLCCFLNTCKGEVTGISFVDSTPIEVCHPCRSRSHKVFQNIAGWGKNSMGWHAASEACLVVVRRRSGRTPCDLNFI